jgi:hypothetical protein
MDAHTQEMPKLISDPELDSRIGKPVRIEAGKGILEEITRYKDDLEYFGVKIGDILHSGIEQHQITFL